VDVSREEEERVPDVVVSEAGGHDYTPRTPYFQQRAPEYSAAARTCLERFLTFVRFGLGQPLLWGAGDAPPRAIESTTWLDADGTPINPGIQVLGSISIGLRDKGWHSHPLSAADEARIRLALKASPDPPLHHVILAQGKDAAIAGDLRRAVMELAIASEVAVKHAFFAPNSPAGEAFEYFEDKSLLRAGVIDLLGEPSRRAFGEGFKDHDEAACQAVEYLFRCRNKVVHRGQLVFRDAKSIVCVADQAVIRDWLGAVLRLFEWLEAKAGLRGLP
jgi:hypothetical protein